MKTASRLHYTTAFMFCCLSAGMISAAYAEEVFIKYELDPGILEQLQYRYPDIAEEYWIDVQYTIRDALNEWSAQNSIAFLPSTESPHVVITWLDSEELWGVHHPYVVQGQSTIGIDFDQKLHDKCGGSALLNLGIVKFVAAHEFGHFLGLGHSAEKDHLMYGPSNPPPERPFDDKGYDVPSFTIENYQSIGEESLVLASNLEGYYVDGVDTFESDGAHYVVVNTAESIQILDITNPTNPAFVNRLGYDGHDTDLVSIGDGHYVTTLTSDGLYILDITDPYNPVEASHITRDIEEALNVKINDSHFLLVLTNGAIQKMDINNPHNPVLAGSYFDGFTLPYVDDMAVSVVDGATYVLVFTEFDGIEIFFVSEAPGLAPAVSIESKQAIVEYENRQFTAKIDDTTYLVTTPPNSIVVEDITKDPDDPVLVGCLFGYDVLDKAATVIDGDLYVAIASGNEGIQIIDLGHDDLGGWRQG